jgi:hypothetical protein
MLKNDKLLAILNVILPTANCSDAAGVCS